MMIVITVALVLFAGISSPAIAEEQIPSQLESAANPNGDSPQSLEYVELLKNECARNGGPEAYDIFKQSEESLSECVFETLKTLQPENITNLCPRLAKFKNCMRNVTENLKPCYEPKDRAAVDVNYNAMRTFVDFACTFGGSIIKQFIANGGIECSISQVAGISDCTRQVFSNYVLAGATGQRRLQSPRGITESSIIEKYIRCALEALNNCRRPMPADVINSVYYSFKQHTSEED